MLKHVKNSSNLLNGIIQHTTLLGPVVTPTIQQRFTSKHYNPKFKSLRRQKFIKIELPNFQQKPEDMTDEELRSKLKEKGVLPQRPWVEAPYFVACTGGIFEEYIPPEGDGKYSAISKRGAKQKVEFLEKKGKSMWAVRKIKSFDETFTTSSFPETAREIYIKAHEMLAKKDNDNIIDYVTERAYPMMLHNVRNKQVVWKFVQSLEPCKVVHVRVTKMHTEDDVFAQVTCRFHTQQILAVYDRFGRLIHGSENLVKDVLEYIVFERHLANEYGNWRIHDKIIPNWVPAKEPVIHTYTLPIEKNEPKQEDAVEQVIPPSEKPVETQATN